MKLGALVHDVALFHSSALCAEMKKIKKLNNRIVSLAGVWEPSVCMLRKQVGPAHYQCLTSLIRAAYNTRTWQMHLSIRQYRAACAILCAASLCGYNTFIIPSNYSFVRIENATKSLESSINCSESRGVIIRNCNFVRDLGVSAHRSACYINNVGRI
uniref:Uncharacterized protein n=1 Tax=Trichogramma kaykai TaxID=54128 RepID=A0ABD2VUS6_9HYME